MAFTDSEKADISEYALSFALRWRAPWTKPEKIIEIAGKFRKFIMSQNGDTVLKMTPPPKQELKHDHDAKMDL